MNKALVGRIACIVLVAVSAASVAAGTISWFVGDRSKTEEENINGEVKLRSYFYAGDGTSDETPFEIVNPTHLSNFSYLQSIGVFATKKYFRIGHDFGHGEIDAATGERIPKYECTDDGVTFYEYLDMDGVTISPIGNESVPFYGEFQGNNIPVQNLTVEGNPDDIGFFGYISYEGKVEGLILEDFTIKSIGYTSSSSTDMYGLFNPNVDNIFNAAGSDFEQASLSFKDLVGNKEYNVKTKDAGDNGSHVVEGNTVQYDVGLSGIGINGINLPANTFTSYVQYDKELEEDVTRTSVGVYKGYFTPHYPNNNDFTYSWRSSSPIVQDATFELPGENNTTVTYPANSNDTILVMDLQTLANSTGAKSFNDGESNMSFSTRISLLATYHDDANRIDYTRVIQSYTLVFHSNCSSAYTDTNNPYSLTIYCDYIYQETSKPNYHRHGNNIGYLAGHLDGRMSNCYVYNGKMSFAGDGNGMKSPTCETETGLVGEVGVNVVNHLDPEYGVSDDDKDTGVLNFTKIYNNIRRDFAVNDVTHAGHNNSPEANYICYDDYVKDTNGNYMPQFLNFQKYLKTHNTVATHYITTAGTTISEIDANDSLYTDDNDSDKHTLTWHNYKITSINSANSVTFNDSAVIQDEEGKERGLGVFKLVLPNAGANHFTEFGSSRIIKGAAKDKVYFSTAEFDHKQIGNDGVAWSGTAPFRGYHTPTYSSTGSFTYQFARDYNYCYELDLSKMNECAENYYYMWNTKAYNDDAHTDRNYFVQNYLSSKLINKMGAAIAYETRTFGFRFQMKDPNDSTKIISLNNLSSYMPIGTLGSKRQSEVYYQWKQGVGQKPNYWAITEEQPTTGSAGNNITGRANLPTTNLEIGQYHKVTEYYPSNSIVFHLDRKANVSVVGNNDDITIYNYDPAQSNNNNTKRAFTMRSTNGNSTDYHRYFTYDVASGLTGVKAVNMPSLSDNDALYGHIFKLDAGDYVICASNSTANIYFLAVQGQENGEMGTDDIQTGVGGNELDNVDFLLTRPSDNNGTLDRAYFTFKANFNGVGNYLEVKPNNANNPTYINVDVRGNSPKFITYLYGHTYSSAAGTKYSANGTSYTSDQTIIDES